MSRFHRSEEGSSLVEFALVFPLIVILTMGTLEFSFGLLQRGRAQKATQLGARVAIVSTPVAPGIKTGLFSGLSPIGAPCTDQTTGITLAACTIASTDCTYSTTSSPPGGTCPGYTFNLTNFDKIFNEMRLAYPTLTRDNVRVSYASNGLGYIGNPSGVPVNVTVAIRCLTYDFRILQRLGILTPPASEAGCPATPTLWPMLGIRTTLTSEDLDSTVAP